MLSGIAVIVLFVPIVGWIEEVIVRRFTAWSCVFWRSLFVLIAMLSFAYLAMLLRAAVLGAITILYEMVSIDPS